MINLRVNLSGIPAELAHLFPEQYIAARIDAKKAICKKGKPCKGEDGNVVCIPKKSACAADSPANAPGLPNKSPVSKSLLIGLAVGAGISGGIGGLALMAASQRNRELESGKNEAEATIKLVKKQAEDAQAKTAEDIKLAAKVEVDTAKDELTKSEAKVGKLSADFSLVQQAAKLLKTQHDSVKKAFDEKEAELTDAQKKLADSESEAEKTRSEIDQLKTGSQELEVAKAEAEKALANQKTYAKGLRTQIDNVKKERDGHLSSLEKAQTELTDTQKQVEAFSTQVAASQQETKTMRSKLAELESNFDKKVAIETAKRKESLDKDYAKKVEEISAKVEEKITGNLSQIQQQYESKLTTETEKIKKQANHEALKQTDPHPRPGENVGNLLLGAENEIRLGTSARKTNKAGEVSDWALLGTEAMPEKVAEKRIASRSADVVEANFTPGFVELSKTLRAELAEIHALEPPDLVSRLKELQTIESLHKEVERVAANAPWLISNMDDKSRAKLALVESALKKHDQREKDLLQAMAKTKEIARESYLEQFAELQQKAKSTGGYDPIALNEFDQQSLRIARQIKAEAKRQADILINKKGEIQKKDSLYWKKHYLAKIYAK